MSVIVMVGINNMAKINELAHQMFTNQLMTVYYAGEANTTPLSIGKALRQGVLFSENPDQVVGQK